MEQLGCHCFQVSIAGWEISLYNIYAAMLRLFDKNYDGYIDKKEFRWMTSSERFSKKTIDIVFEVTICKLAGQEARAKLNYLGWRDTNSLTIRVKFQV